MPRETQAFATTLTKLREALEDAYGERVHWALDDHGAPIGYGKGVVYGYTEGTERYVVALRIGGTWDGLVTIDSARDVIDRHRASAGLAGDHWLTDRPSR